MTPQRAREAALEVLAARQHLIGGKYAVLGPAVPWWRRIDPVWRERHLYRPAMRVYRRRGARR